MIRLVLMAVLSFGWMASSEPVKTEVEHVGVSESCLKAIIGYKLVTDLQKATADRNNLVENAWEKILSQCNPVNQVKVEPDLAK